jgi:hypothetical protein
LASRAPGALGASHCASRMSSPSIGRMHRIQGGGWHLVDAIKPPPPCPCPCPPCFPRISLGYQQAAVESLTREGRGAAAAYSPRPTKTASYFTCYPPCNCQVVCRCGRGRRRKSRCLSPGRFQEPQRSNPALSCVGMPISRGFRLSRDIRAVPRRADAVAPRRYETNRPGTFMLSYCISDGSSGGSWTFQTPIGKPEKQRRKSDSPSTSRDAR